MWIIMNDSMPNDIPIEVSLRIECKDEGGRGGWRVRVGV